MRKLRSIAFFAAGVLAVTASTAHGAEPIACSGPDRIDLDLTARRQRVLEAGRIALLLVWTLAGCANSTSSQRHLDGPRGLITSSAESREGYEVSVDCRVKGALGVIGTGMSWFGDAPPGTPARDAALVRFKDTVVEPAFEGMASVEGMGVGVGCRQLGVVVSLSDASESDAVIRRAGTLLRSNLLREEISFFVSGVPVLVEQ